MWEQLLAAGDGHRLDDRSSLEDWFESVERIIARSRDRLPRRVTQATLALDDGAWALWVRCVRALWVVAGRHLRDQRRSRDANRWIPDTQPVTGGPDFIVDPEKVVRLADEYARLCVPRPNWLPKRKKMVMPNGFSIKKARVRPTRAGRPDPYYPFDPAVADRDFFVLVFASFCVPAVPICMTCEESIPPTKSGRRSRKTACRACQNARHYERLKRRDPNKLRDAWRASKRMTRRNQV